MVMFLKDWRMELVLAGELQWPFVSSENLCTQTSGGILHSASAETRVDSFPKASADLWSQPVKSGAPNDESIWKAKTTAALAVVRFEYAAKGVALVVAGQPVVELGFAFLLCLV